MTEEQTKFDQPLSGCFLRLLWAIFGPALLLLTGVMIAANKSLVGSPADIIFAAILVIVIIARLVDRPKPATQSGSTTERDISTSDPRKYIFGILVVAAGIYGLAHFVLQGVL